MYTEKQNFHSYPIRWFKGLCWVVVGLQLPLLFAAESDFIRLPFGIYMPLILMIIGIAALLLMQQLGFHLRISQSGIDLRFWQYPVQTHHIFWTDIKRLRLISSDELPPDAYWGIPNRDAKYVYLLTEQRFKVLSIELVNGTQLFVSTQKEAELLNFLQDSPQMFIRQ